MAGRHIDWWISLTGMVLDEMKTGLPIDKAVEDDWVNWISRATKVGVAHLTY